MDFTASPYPQTIPSKSTIVPSDHQLEYSDGQTLRFEVPDFMGFIDPRQSYLKFNVKATCSSISTFSKKCGIQSIINNMRIYDGTQSHTLENLQNYAELIEKTAHYSENDSIKNKRALLELLEPTSRDWGGVSYDNDPSQTFNNSQLGNGYKTGAFDYQSDVNRQDDATPNSCEVAMKLESGILGSTKMYPAMLSQGLKIEIETNNAAKCLQLWSGAGVVTNGGEVDTRLAGSCRFGIASALPVGAVALTSVVLNVSTVPGAHQIATAPAITAGALAAGAKVVLNGAVGASNLVVGRKLWGWAIGAANTDPSVWSDMGTITSVSYNGGEATGGAIQLTVGLDGTGVNGSLFQGGAGGGVALADEVPKTNTCGIKRSDATAVCKYSLSNVELVLKTASPPKAYIDNLMKAVATEEGATYDFMTFNTYRNNVPANEQITQLNIPAFNQRAVSVLTVPIENGLAENLGNDNLASVLDNAEFYNYYVNGKSQPTTKVPLKRLSNTTPLVEQVALWETEKALATSKVSVRNLQSPEKNFIIARPLSRYGGCFDTRTSGAVGLKVEYSTSTPPSKQKLFISYIGGLRRMVVSKEGMRIEL